MLSRTPAGFRTLVALHVAPVVPLVALAAWFGLVDTTGIGEGRCPSCGVEGAVIAVHVVAAVLLAGVVVACDLVRAPEGELGRLTRIVLPVAAVFLLVSLAWHRAFDLFGLAMLVASPLTALAVAVWWLVVLVELLRTRTTAAGGLLARAWICLLVLLPGLFAWVWADRVDWFTF